MSYYVLTLGCLESSDFDRSFIRAICVGAPHRWYPIIADLSLHVLDIVQTSEVVE